MINPIQSELDATVALAQQFQILINQSNVSKDAMCILGRVMACSAYQDANKKEEVTAKLIHFMYNKTY